MISHRAASPIQTATEAASFFAFPLMAHLDQVAPRPVLLAAGADAHSRYYSEGVHGSSPQNRSSSSRLRPRRPL
jgi:hypothetical protein